MNLILVFVGGGIGAALRYVISLWAGNFFPQIFKSQIAEFPFGTLISNIIPSFIIGFLTGLDFIRFLSYESKIFIGTGICGGLSTYSAFALESMNLLRDKYYLLFALNIILNNVFTIGFAIIGFLAGKKFGSGS